MREREDEMKVLDGQQLRAPGGEPPLFRKGLAFGTVPIAARVVGESLGPARVTGFPMPPEGRGAAGLDGTHGAARGAGQPMGLPIRRAMGAEDIGQLHRPGPPCGRRHVGRGRRGHRRASVLDGSGKSRGEPVRSTRPWLR
jgi:hypothetical protein